MEEQVIIGTPGKVWCCPASRKSPQLLHYVRSRCTLCMPLDTSGHSARLSTPCRASPSPSLNPNPDRHPVLLNFNRCGR